MNQLLEKIKALNIPFIVDPKNKEPSVSLSLLLVSFVVLCVVGMLQVFGKVQTTGPFESLFYATCGLYFSRRVNLSKDKNEIEKEEK